MSNINHPLSYPNTNWGYLIRNNYYDSLDLEFNNIYNLHYGIDVGSNALYLPYPSPPAASMVLNNNSILPNKGSATSGYVYIGISVNNVTKQYYMGYSGNVNVDNNTISAYNGIWINGIQNQHATSNSNTITMVSQPTGSVIRKTQYGIAHSYCVKNMIYGNGPKGPIMGKGTGVMNDSCRAVYVAFSNYPIVNCNNEDSIGRGFEFFGKQTQASTQWQQNSMTANLKGFVLNMTIIQTQGSYLSAMDNAWMPPPLYWTGSNFGTFVHDTLIGSTRPYSAAHSPFYEYGALGSPYYPPNNISNPTGSQYSMPSTIYTSISQAYACSIKLHKISPTVVQQHEAVAADSLGLGTVDPLGAWMSQFGLWQELQTDSEMVDSSAMLLDFDSLATHSRFAYLTRIENNLAHGHYSAAQCLLNNTSLQTATGTTYGTTGAVVEDSSAADSIVYTYLSFYHLYKMYMQD